MKCLGQWSIVINARDPQSVVKNKEEHFSGFAVFLNAQNHQNKHLNLFI